jgi:hypothetical protein
MQQQLHMVPISDMHRFCIVEQATLSSVAQVIFMPPVHFSIVTLQRGTIMDDMGVMPPLIGIPMPGIIVPGIAIPVDIGFIVVIIEATPCRSPLAPPTSDDA